MPIGGRAPARSVGRSSGGERQRDGAQGAERGGEAIGPRPLLRQVQPEASGRAGQASRQGEEPPAQGLGRDQRLAEADTAGPAREVVGHHLQREPRGVGPEAPRGQVVEPDAVLEVADGVLDLGVASVIGLERERLALRGR